MLDITLVPTFLLTDRAHFITFNSNVLNLSLRLVMSTGECLGSSYGWSFWGWATRLFLLGDLKKRILIITVKVIEPWRRKIIWNLYTELPILSSNQTTPQLFLFTWIYRARYHLCTDEGSYGPSSSVFFSVVLYLGRSGPFHKSYEVQNPITWKSFYGFSRQNNLSC